VVNNYAPVDSGSDDPYRPVYHFAPGAGWMNDPNGLVYHDETYHLFYQAGEKRRRWDHATGDLVGWAEQGAKLPVEPGVQQYSGGAVVDEGNDAGFGAGAIVATYTGHHDDGVEDQRLAYSTDGGDSFRTFGDNPVIGSDVGDFRDPNVVRYDGEWRLVVARVAPTDDRSTGVEVYSSPDLREWTYESTVPTGHVPGVHNWECPDLFELPVEGGDSRWCLLVSADWEQQELYVGEFDGTAFVPDQRFLVDHGHDFYAGMTWANDPDGRRLLTGWLNHWEYAMDLPDPGWRGVQAFPRRLSLAEDDDGLALCQRPATELAAVRGDRLVDVRSESLGPGDDPLAGSDVAGRALVVEARLSLGGAGRVSVHVREGDGEATSVHYDADAERLSLDRSDAGAFFDDDRYPRSSAPLSLSDETLDLQLLVDRSSVEVFAAGGRVAMSNLVYPDPESVAVSLSADGGTAELRRFSVDRVPAERRG
jgi:fructan beta-fructosidase